MDKDIVFEKLLCYGLFPERLEGIFSSENFGKWVIKNKGSLNIGNKHLFSLLSYKLTRNNNSPRFLSIPHPLGFIRLCKEIDKNWDKINEKFKDVSNYKKTSMIIPNLFNKNKRLVSMASYDQPAEKEQLQLDKQFGKKYFVRADISNFFPSIYTHSISWALVGKNEAKTNRHEESCWYNKLDKCIRNLQDGETKGIPIGTDTSAIFSELVLSQVDKKLEKYDYVRFIDDYKCFCVSKEDAENFILDLSLNIEEYRLTLNTKKTKILSLPQALHNDWVRKLRQFVDWKKIDKFSKNKVFSFLDLSSDLFRENPDESPIRYATQVLKKKEYGDYSAYNLILRYFLNLCFLYPYIIDICDEFIKIGIITFPKAEDKIKNILKSAIEKILKEHIKYRRSDVIAWCLFLAIKYDIRLADFSKIGSDILKIKDCIPALMGFLYAKINGAKITGFLDLVDNVDENKWWLYIYEINRINKTSFPNSEMEKMRKAKITFLSDEINQKLCQNQ